MTASPALRSSSFTVSFPRLMLAFSGTVTVASPAVSATVNIQPAASTALTVPAWREVFSVAAVGAFPAGGFASGVFAGAAAWFAATAVPTTPPVRRTDRISANSLYGTCVLSPLLCAV